MTPYLPKYVDNDDLYQAYPWLHAFACHSFVSVTPTSYPAIKGWIIAVDVEGTPVGVIEPVFEDWYCPPAPLPQKEHA
jgi:hypothetical protein